MAEGKVYEEEFGIPMLSIEVQGWNYSFSVMGIPEEKHQWLIDSIGSIAEEIHERAVKIGEDNVKRKISDALSFITDERI